MNNIAVIASDLDGTLLRDDKRLPEQFPALLRALSARGIRFIAASGRQYYNIYEQLACTGMADEIDYIAENGAMTVVGGEVCSVEEMPAEDVVQIVETVRRTEGCYPILCGADGAYFENDFPEMRHHTRMYYARLTLVKDVLDYAAHDRICKIAVFNSHHAEEVTIPALQPFADRMQIALSGDCWVDAMNRSVTKGAALHVMLARMGVSAVQCMAFGDYLNDIELLEASGHPFAMENAHPLVRGRFPLTDGDNNADGVVRTVCRELDIAL